MINKEEVSNKYVIGVDLGGTFIKFGYARATGELLFRDKIPTRVSHGPETILSDVANKILEMIEKNGNKKEDVLGCGMGCPGTVDMEFRTVIFAPNLKWNNVNVKDTIEKLTGITTYIDNDANLAGLGEFWLGAGQGTHDFICVTLGTGIGGGIIINGNVLRGQNNNAAEIGHMTIDINGQQCSCGNYGCWERYGSATALVNRVLSKLSVSQSQRSKISSAVFDLCSNDLSKLNCEIIFEAARLNDPIAKNAVNLQIEYIAIGLVNLVYLFNPQKIVIVGGLANATEDLIKPVVDAVIKKAPKVSTNGLEITTGKLGGDSGTLGAVYLVLNEISKK